MFWYFATEVTANESGSELLTVFCDKCDCEYCFEITRVGSHRVYQPYGIGSGSAKEAAREKANVDLQKRLRSEADLVPCPRCNWINDSLVEGYRRTCYRHWEIFAVISAIIGITISLVAAWMIHVGHAADKGAFYYFVIGGPVFSIFFAAMVIGIQSWLRTRIRPNGRFPLPPKLPPRTPPALYFDEQTQLFLPWHPKKEELRFEDGWRVFIVGRHCYPERCCVCNEDTSFEQKKSVDDSISPEMDIPVCRSCALQILFNFWLIWMLTVACSIFLLVLALKAMNVDADTFWVMSILASCVMLAFASFVASCFTAPYQLGSPDKETGATRLRFKHPDFHPVEIHQ